MEATTNTAEPTIGRWPRRRVLTVGALLAYLLATVAFVLASGRVLDSRDVVFAWVLLGLLVISLNDVRGFARGFVFDWLPFFAILWVYDFTRNLAKHSPFPVHSAAQIRFDKLIHDPIPTVWLQRHLYHPPHAALHDYAAWGVYMTHFFGTILVAAYLWKWAHPRFRRWRTVVLWLSAAGMATYVLYPAAPPWLSSAQGSIPHVEQIIPQLFRHMNISEVHSLAEADFANKVAAVPSLHSAFPVLMLCFFWASGWRARIFFGVYSVAMAVTLVYTAEHYVADIVAGWSYALASGSGSPVVAKERAPRRGAPRRAPRRTRPAPARRGRRRRDARRRSAVQRGPRLTRRPGAKLITTRAGPARVRSTRVQLPGAADTQPAPLASFQYCV